MTRYINQIHGELTAWLEGGELGREAYRAGVIAEAQERGRQRASVTVQPNVAPTPAPVAWTLAKPQRFPGYSRPLYELLRRAHVAGANRPTARDVLDAWQRQRPTEVLEVTADEVKFYDNGGNIHTADTRAITKAIGRMTAR
jgi:hypothetical protein